MAVIRSILKKTQPMRSLFLQLLFVILAFFLMVVSTWSYVNNMLRNHLSREARDILIQTRLEIEAEFIEPQTTLTAMTITIRGMILQGSGAEAVKEYMGEISREMQDKIAGFQYGGIYGYFEAFGGMFIHSEGWEGEEDYDPTERPWYRAAVEGGNKIAVTEVYRNVRHNNYLVTFAHRIFDGQDRPLGMVCLNVPLDRIRNTVANMRVTQSGYGMLTDGTLHILSHPHQGLIHQNASELSPDFSRLSGELVSGRDILGREVTNYYGERAIVFSMQLANGWILFILTPRAEYYKELQNLNVIIGILGAVLAVVLMLILISVDRAKNRADKQSRKKSMLLVELEKMREADERVRVMLDATPLAVNFFDKNLKNVECNEEALKLFEIPDKQEYLDRFFELSPEYQPGGKSSKEMTIEKVAEAFENNYCRFEWMHQKLNGEEIPSEITLVPANYRGEDILLCYIRDLRELKAAIAEMHEADERAQLMFDAMPFGCKLWDKNYKIIECNPETLKLFGLSGKEEFFERFFELSPEYQPCGRTSAALVFEYIQEALEEGSHRFEWMHQKINGEPIPTEITLVRVKYKGDSVVAGYIRDLRELKAMLGEIQKVEDDLRAARDVAEENNKTKSRFLATMSHEIRTPMNMILGVTENQLQLDTHSEETQEAFEKIYNAGDLLIHIINDILDLSKIEAGKFELNPIKYEVASLINDAAQLNIARFEHKPIEFKLQADKNIPARLFGDELRIKQILNNLLSNAFKYTDSGSVTLSFTVDAAPEEKEKVMFMAQITDTGQGMTPEQVEQLFDEYARFNLEANRTTVGTGLGMNITRSLVKMMDGTISVDSTPGVGSTFTVRIPQGKAGSGILGKETAENFEKFHFKNRAQIKNKKIVREPMPYGKVLVVDDMKSNLDVAKLLLTPYGLQIDTAGSGFDAIDMIENGKAYDIIFMDHMMPKMDGMETVKNIRGLGYRQPIFALTANAIAGQQEIFLANGFDGYISKPIDIRQLNDSLNKFIRDKQPPEVIEAARKNEYKKPVSDNALNIEIPGLDTEAGLALCDGDVDVYLSILRSYVPNALEVIGKLRGVSQETLSDYAINVHGLKGISATVGAEKIRKAALNSEMMAKSGDLDGVLANNGTLLHEAEILVSGIQAWLTELDNRNPKPLLPFPDRLLLAKLQKCCEDYDMDGIDEAMDMLESSDYSRDASLVSWLREQIDSLDFSEAAERIAAYSEGAP